MLPLTPVRWWRLLAGPAGSQSFGYDANGNMSSRNGKTLSWTAAQLPKRINYTGSDYAEFDYGPDRQRIRQVARTGGTTVTTWYIGPHFEVQVSGGNRRYQSNIFVNGEAILSQVEQSNPLTFDAYFVHRDHQGSVDALSRFVGCRPAADRAALRCLRQAAQCRLDG